MGRCRFPGLALSKGRRHNPPRHAFSKTNRISEAVSDAHTRTALSLGDRSLRRDRASHLPCLCGNGLVYRRALSSA
jgi:hypothetical protein